MKLKIRTMTEEIVPPTPAATSPPPGSAFVRKTSQQFFRFFSTSESTRSSVYIYGETNAKPQWDHNFCSLEFLLKFAQILVAIVCTGVYTEGIKVIQHSITTAMFPNVVLSAFIIITSVIIISYVLGHVMPEVLIRIFNSLGAILYFVSAGVTGQYWVVQGRLEARDGLKNQFEMDMILATTVLTFCNAVLYAVDVFFSMKKTLRSMEIPRVPEVKNKDVNTRQSKV